MKIVFFRAKSTCTLFFIGSIFMCVLMVSRNSTGELDMITQAYVYLTVGLLCAVELLFICTSAQINNQYDA